MTFLLCCCFRLASEVLCARTQQISNKGLKPYRTYSNRIGQSVNIRCMKILASLKDFYSKYEREIILSLGFLVACGISFQAGVLQGQKWQQKPLIIEKPAQTPVKGETAKFEASGGSKEASGSSSGTAGATQATVGANTANCAYVSSKNSDKFYVPTCTWAKRIKPENLVCYKSEQEALGKGKVKSDCK